MAVIHVGYSRDHFFDPIRELDQIIRQYVTDLPDPLGPLVWNRINLLPTGTFGSDGHKFLIVAVQGQAAFDYTLHIGTNRFAGEVGDRRWSVRTHCGRLIQAHGLRIFAIDEVAAAKRAWVRSTATSKGRQRIGLCKTCRVGKYPEILDAVHAISQWELDIS